MWARLGVLSICLLGCRQSSSLPSVRIGVGGQSQIVYLPATLAQQLGYYKEEGVLADLQDFPGGAKALEALHGGSVDIVCGFYDHTIQMAAEGRPLRAFVTLLRLPGLVLAARSATRLEDLKGATIGVSAPGSSTHLFARYLFQQRGLSGDDFSAVGIGMAATAVAAMERGKVEAAVMTDPALAQVIHRGVKVNLLADTRTTEGVKSIFGVDAYPASVLYAKSDWLDRNPDTARRLARAMCRTLDWIHSHSPEEVMARLPESFRGQDPAVYVESLRNSMQMFSPDGRMPSDGPEAVRKVLSGSLETVRNARIDLAQTYTNAYVE
jgi:NitT/TauT family transport system substrate-binding protein